MLLRNKNLPYKGLISISFINLQMHKILIFYLWYVHFPYFINIRILEIHLFYTIAIFYWHLIEILWIFIFLVFYNIFLFLYFSSFLISSVLEFKSQYSRYFSHFLNNMNPDNDMKPTVDTFFCNLQDAYKDSEQRP